jgi:hypothetical protein
MTAEPFAVPTSVIAALVAAIHVFTTDRLQAVCLDPRDEREDDG